MNKPRYLTKSRYKTGLECPTKLFYTGKQEYSNNKLDDPFMEALAQGGYQVGELAKCYYPGGHDITSLDYDEAEQQTRELLKLDNVVIYEAAIRFENLFIRIDILIKQGNHLELIEVKAKSYDSTSESPFFGKRGGLSGDWSAYLYDVAFQNYVLTHAYPEFTIQNNLMLADKKSKCKTTGLNQKFRITRDNNRKGIAISSDLSDKDLAHKVLIKVPVDQAVSYIHEDLTEDGVSFEDTIKTLAYEYQHDRKINGIIGSKCKNCEFTTSNDEEATGLKSGFKECWSQTLGWNDNDFSEPTVLDIWNYRSTNKLIEQGKFKLIDLCEDDLNIKDDSKPGLSNSQRQWLQIEKVKNSDNDAYFDIEGMKKEMETWVFPLHFIDFETTMVALPFTKGRKPYEGIAFQFSHHIYHEDGRIEHFDQYLNTERGVFPNIDFIRALKASLENDNGTIFRYADHENTYLNMIYRQIQEVANEINDSETLCDFIKNITHSTSKSSESWVGERDMVDMLALVKRYYYDPVTNGSNSIKAVLPATLNSSTFLQSKYSKPIYGTEHGIKSFNFNNKSWVEKVDGKVVDPYKNIPKLFDDITDKKLELLSDTDELNNGGAALTAYSKIQFHEMHDDERKALEEGLLRYCELDTFAMVMIYEAWLNMCA